LALAPAHTGNARTHRRLEVRSTSRRARARLRPRPFLDARARRRSVDDARGDANGKDAREEDESTRIRGGIEFATRARDDGRATEGGRRWDRRRRTRVVVVSNARARGRGGGV